LSSDLDAVAAIARERIARRSAGRLAIFGSWNNSVRPPVEASHKFPVEHYQKL
jgi:hypothetical protein